MYKPTQILVSMILAIASQVSAAQTPLNFSLVGPLSSSFDKASTTDHSFCFGILGCSSHHVYGATIGFPGVTLTYGNLSGVGFAYLGNWVNGSQSGVLIGGLANVVSGPVNGLQLALGANLNFASFSGFQLALINVVSHETEGMQLGVVNYSGSNSEGSRPGSTFQLGLINISENPESISFGLINIVRGGRLTIGYDIDAFAGVFPTIRQGSQSFYFVVIPGLDVLDLKDTNRRLYYQGFGLGFQIAKFENALGLIGECRWVDAETSDLSDEYSGCRLVAEYSNADSGLTATGGLEYLTAKEQGLFASDKRLGMTSGLGWNMMSVLW